MDRREKIEWPKHSLLSRRKKKSRNRSHYLQSLIETRKSRRFASPRTFLRDLIGGDASHCFVSQVASRGGGPSFVSRSLKKRKKKQTGPKTMTTIARRFLWFGRLLWAQCTQRQCSRRCCCGTSHFLRLASLFLNDEAILRAARTLHLVEIGPPTICVQPAREKLLLLLAQL
jgi:hypothetical protein